MGRDERFDVITVIREIRVWVRNMVGEGHATVRRNRRAAEAELAAVDR